MGKSRPLDRTDRQLATLLFALALAGYLRMAAPDVLAGDPGEFQFAAWRWGLAHPTGYPLYLIAGGLWQRLLALFGVSPAAALNVFSSVTGAAAVAVCYLVARRWLAAPPATRLAAGFAAVLLATNPTFWSQSLIAEVYALHALLALLVLYAAQGLAGAAGSGGPLSVRRVAGLALLFGLGLAHHASIVFLAPGLLLYLTLLDRGWWRRPRVWAALAAAALPLPLYLYVPLRSGPEASPWYHQQVGGTVLSLYDGSWASFVDFITGRSISVGFHSVGEAAAALGQAGRLWWLHLSWPGLLLAALGLYVLVRGRRWEVLALTAPYAVLQQGFNLFYAIGDILVYYIPLYLVAGLWASFGAAALAKGDWRGAWAAGEAAEQPGGLSPGMLTLVALLLFAFPLRQASSYAEALDQSESRSARRQWEALLAAAPPQPAALVSNDRDEMVPLFYFQAVEGRGGGLAGLFPLLAPDARFADLGATLETALAADDPVYLIKEMPGLEARFALAPAEDPLVRVLGPAAAAAPEHKVGQSYGPLTLLGYDWAESAAGVDIVLHWRVEQALGADYTSTVQLLDGGGNKLAQDDRPPGGVYYPTSLWKPGERLLDRHPLAGVEGRPAQILIGMYTGADLTPLAPPLLLTPP